MSGDCFLPHFTLTPEQREALVRAHTKQIHPKYTPPTKDEQSMFTQQHYIKLAHTLRECMPIIVEPEERRAHYSACQHLARMFEDDNKAFNREKFMAAIGYTTHTQQQPTGDEHAV